VSGHLGKIIGEFIIFVSIPLFENVLPESFNDITLSECGFSDLLFPESGFSDLRQLHSEHFLPTKVSADLLLFIYFR
jgi:hypothetical protein|tara:strand:+ start:265 stop:495 length:231 start_codon:yes stop_codon:yes gene_type:complete